MFLILGKSKEREISRKKYFTVFRITFICFLLFIPNICFASVNSHKKNEEPSQIFLSFRYKYLIDNVLTVYYENNKVYLPIGQIFDLLKINNTIDIKKQSISGFFLNPKTKYEINFKDLTATVGKKSYRFSKNDFMASELDYYVTADLINKLFGLTFNPNMRSLSLSLTTNLTLPIEASVKRQNREHLIGNVFKGRPYYPLLFNRKRYILKTGVLDYNFNSTYDGISFNNSLDLTGGLKFLNGNLIGDVSGYSFAGKFHSNVNNLQWQYVAKDGDPITQVYVGDIYSNGLNPLNFEGIQITNEPIHRRILFEHYVVDGNTKPNYDVELYLNDHLVAQTKTGHDGHYHLMVPLYYGTSSVTIKFYGPEGQFHEERRRIQVPYTFLPKGNISYSLNLGGYTKNRQYSFQKPDNYLLAPNVSMGVTDWFTNKIGVDYGKKTTFYNTSSFRIGSPYLAALTISPSNLYQATFSALYPSQSSFELQASHYGTDYLYNTYGSSYDEGSGSFYLPFQIANHPVNFRFRGNIQRLPNQTIYGYGIGGTVNFGRVILSNSYNLRSIGGSTINSNVYWSLSNASKLPFFLRGSFLSGTFNYNESLHSVTNVGLEYSRTIFRYARLQVSWMRDLFFKQSSLQFRLIFHFPTVTTSSSYIRSSQRYLMAENIRGGIGYDGHNHNAMLNNRQLTGSASATIKMFVDYNGNGVQDKGEPILKDGNVSFDQAVSMRRDHQGLLHVVNLQPYYRYNITVDASKVKNPLWIPSIKQFSFIANPNIVTPIDIPFYVSGVIDGVIRKNGKGLPGLKIHFKQINGHYQKTVSTFSDGSFYFMGLPPGKYEVVPDKKQMNMLEVISQPESRKITVKYTKNGVNISRLNFNLISKREAIQQSKKDSIEDINYGVQVGAFHNIDLAIAQINRKTNYEWLLRYKPTIRDFVITTNCFPDSATASSLLKRIRNLNYPDAFILRGCQKLTNHLIFKILLATYHSKDAVKAGETQADSLLKKSVYIVQDSTSSKYDLYLNQKLVKWKTAASVLKKVKSKGFQKAMILTIPEVTWLNQKNTYQVQFGVYNRYQAAIPYQKALKSLINKSVIIKYDKTAHIYRLLLDGKDTWQEAQRFRNEFQKMKKIEPMFILLQKKESH